MANDQHSTSRCNTLRGYVRRADLFQSTLAWRPINRLEGECMRWIWINTQW